VVYDEGDDNAGVAPASPGGGKVATVVVTSHGPRHLQDSTPYTHYSLLKTIQRNFSLGCLAHSCDTTVAGMSKLFTVTGAPAAATSAQPVPFVATPTPTPTEPVSTTTNHDSRDGWSVQPAPQLGTGDNSFGAISAASPRDIWAVGNFLPDTKASNPDATLSLAAHYNGTRWTSTATPNTGPNFTTLFGVAATGGQAWAVGDALDSRYAARSVIEHWDGSRWTLIRTPALPGQRDMLFSAAASSPRNVWAVGQQQNQAGRFSTLVEHYDGHRWTVIPAPNPGSSGNSFYAAASTGRDVFAVGQRSSPAGDSPLVEHYDGRRWTVVGDGHARRVNGVLDAVTIRNGQVWAAGQTDDASRTARPLIEHLDPAGRATRRTVQTGGTGFANLNGIAVDPTGTVWASGTVFDPAGTYDGSPGGVQQTLILRRDPSGWHRINAPSPGSADRVLGGMIATGRHLITVGYFKAPAGRQPLIETHHVG